MSQKTDLVAIVHQQLELLADHVKSNGRALDLEFVQVHAMMVAELASLAQSSADSISLPPVESSLRQDFPLV